MKKNNYIYPAVFTFEEGQEIAVLFPDFDVATCGDDLDDAMDMSKECLALQLKGLKEDGEAFPTPSTLDKIDPTTYLSDLGHNVPAIRLIGVDLDD